ncbi:hypothetical protein FO519_002899 [Halicephalobus sp. NKZ332]|nr:hypothetical protein FO519_002899 [Halicephalobus sp. NKZ332]
MVFIRNLSGSEFCERIPTSATGPSQPQGIERNLSALNLGLLGSGEENSTIGPLRKASSFIHGTSFGIGRKPSNSSLLQLPPSFQIGGNFGQVNHPVTQSPEDLHQQNSGLSMSTPNTLAVQKNEIHHSSSMGGGLFNSSSSDSNTTRVTGGIVPNNSSDSLSSANHKGGVMSVFGRGFFAKPMRSEEENYRYIMAFDR